MRRAGPWQRTYLVPEGAFAVAGPGRRQEPAYVSSVASYAHRLAGTSAIATALHTDVLGQTGPLLRQIHELQFCLAELMPYLCARKGQQSPSVAGLADLVEQAQEIERDLDQLLQPEPYAEQLAETLGVPCVIVGRAVIPLERVRRRRSTEFHVEIGGGLYRLVMEQTQAVQDFQRTAEGALLAHVRGAVLSNDTLKATIKEFRTGLRALMRRFKPSQQIGYAVFHEDDEHQLQHSAGVWLLVRGPLRMRMRDDAVFVSLRVRGRTRKERLSVAPALTRNERGLWRSPGVPVRSGLCMGLGHQYRLLQSDAFTEPEAVVQWLDAGAILATARPEFHQRWLGARANT